MKTWVTRKRLDIPAVHELLAAQARMLDSWSETEPGSPERNRLWRDLHGTADEVWSLAYGGASTRTRLSYALRPFDMLADRRRWFWQKPQRCGFNP